MRLELPETGVCNSNPVLDDDAIAATGGCCGTPAAETGAAPAGRGLATGISGGLLSTPLNLVSVTAPKTTEQPGGGCCS